MLFSVKRSGSMYVVPFDSTWRRSRLFRFWPNVSVVASTLLHFFSAVATRL